MFTLDRAPLIMSLMELSFLWKLLAPMAKTPLGWALVSFCCGFKFLDLACDLILLSFFFLFSFLFLFFFFPGAIVGIVVGVLGLMLLAGIVVAMFLVRQNRKTKQLQKIMDHELVRNSS